MQIEFTHRVGPEADATIEEFKVLYEGRQHGEKLCLSCFQVKLPHLMVTAACCKDCS